MAIGQNAIGAAFDVMTTTAKFKVGTRMFGSDGKEYIYVQANGAITVNHWAAVDEDYQAVLGTSALADAKHLIGIAETAFADNEYGWLTLRGSNVTATFSGTVAADAQLFTSSTSGQFSAVTSGAKLAGITNTTATSTTGATSEIIMTYPHWVGASN